MYLTAHRVRADSGRRGASPSGFNAFAYLHGEQPVPASLSIDEVAETAPGEMVEQSVEVPPGGNFVDSYLDVVASDELGRDRLRQLLDALADDVPALRTEFSNLDAAGGSRSSLRQSPRAGHLRTLRV